MNFDPYHANIVATVNSATECRKLVQRYTSFDVVKDEDDIPKLDPIQLQFYNANGPDPEHSCGHDYIHVIMYDRRTMEEYDGYFSARAIIEAVEAVAPQVIPRGEF